jgi:hypothetical protein
VKVIHLSLVAGPCSWHPCQVHGNAVDAVDTEEGGLRSGEKGVGELTNTVSNVLILRKTSTDHVIDEYDGGRSSYVSPNMMLSQVIQQDML